MKMTVFNTCTGVGKPTAQDTGRNLIVNLDKKVQNYKKKSWVVLVDVDA